MRNSSDSPPRIVVVADGDVPAGLTAPFVELALPRDEIAGECDVLVVVLSGVSLRALEWALTRWTALGRPELVFVSGQLTAQPLGEGLGAAGVRYVVSEAAAAAWLLEHAGALAAFTRARRALGEATRRLPPRPCPEDQPPVGLFQAEQIFRTSYIRLLLARSSTRREAAGKARVAYRTFCHILEKLGLSARKLRGRGQELALAEDPSVSLPSGAATPNHGERENPPDDERIS